MQSHTVNRDAFVGENTEPSEVLRLLFWLRVVAILSQTLIIAAVHAGLGIELPLVPLGVTIAALAGWNLFAHWRLRRLDTVSRTEVVLNLAVDVAAFTSAIYFTGGPTNPFVSLYLVPIALAATSLPARSAWLVGGLCGAGYSLLLIRHVPLPMVRSPIGSASDLHIVGMWINFLVAAALIVFFAGRMGRLLRQRDQQIASMREAALRDQQVVALGTLAAGTAHELNTPLATLALLVEELEETATDAEQKERLRVMQQQIEVMNRRLNEIASRVGAGRSQGARCVALRSFLESLIGEWSASHPDVSASVSYELAAPDTEIVAEATIEHAIRNVLDNAAHATSLNGRSGIEISVSCPNGELTVAVLDGGDGIHPSVRDEIGFKIQSTKDRGLGIGLLLSRAALRHFGGKLELASRPAGGVEAKIHLPLERLIAHAG